MDKRSLDFLRRLMGAMGPSGFENENAAVWRSEAETFADEVRRDLHGNLDCVVNEGGAPRIMLAGHMDEIGFMVTHVDDNGYLSFAPIGGWDSQIPQGQRVWIGGDHDRVTGVIGKKPIHLLKSEDRKKVTKIEKMWIDIGVSSREEALELIEIGDPIVLAWDPWALRNDLWVSRGFDNKSGAFVVLEAARMLSKMNPAAEIHAVATVQEEIGLRGARTSAFAVDPEVGIAVDVTFATDHPGVKEEEKKVGKVELGQGPVVARGANVNPKLFRLIQDTARANDIPIQLKGAPRGTGTDANAMQLTRAGVATALISVPNRYMHSPCEMVHLNDLEQVFTLIAHVVNKIDDASDFTLY